jgi:hypothetical protein
MKAEVAVVVCRHCAGGRILFLPVCGIVKNTRMDHWITTHNPHPDPDTIEWNVYAKTHPTKYPAQWDQVLFYETETTITGRYRPGAKALVRAARVCGGIERRAVPIDGFDYQIPCDCHRLAKRNVPYAEVFELIPRFVQPKGWLWISSQEYFTLLAAMKLEEL